MKLPFKPHESYLIRHKILEYLYTKGSEEDNYQEPSVLYNIENISENISISYEKIKLYHEILHDLKEIECNRDDCNDKDGKHKMKITSDGRQAYIGKKYLKEGHEERRNIIKDYSAIISPIISVLSLIVAVIAVSKSYLRSPQESKVTLQIESKVPELKIQESKDTLSNPRIQGQ